MEINSEMKILITGGSGLLGSKLSSIAVAKGYDTYSSYCRNRPRYGVPVYLDITNEKQVSKVFEKTKPDVIVHLAALTDVDFCEEEKDLAWKVNAVGTRNIATFARKTRAFMIFVSTDYVFRGDTGRYTETDTLDPVNFYGMTKVEAEKEVASAGEDWCIARPSVIFGANSLPGRLNFALWIVENLRENNPICVITDQWVSPTLNTNLSDMVLEIVDRRMTGVFHLAGATPVSRFEFAEKIAESFDLDKNLIRPTVLEDMKWKAKRPCNTSLNVDKASRILRNEPFNLTKSLKILKTESESNHP